MYGSFSRSVWPGGGPSHSFNCPLSQQMQQPNVQLLQKSLAYYDNCSKKLWTSISVNTSQSQLLLNSEFSSSFSSPSPGSNGHCGGVGQSEGCQPLLLTGGKLGFRARKQASPNQDQLTSVHCNSACLGLGQWWNTQTSPSHRFL